jgi:prephenate dehydrogenase
MAKSKAVMALAKVMIAAAWADGSINNDEINSLKDLLFQSIHRLVRQNATGWSQICRLPFLQARIKPWH